MEFLESLKFRFLLFYDLRILVEIWLGPVLTLSVFSIHRVTGIGEFFMLWHWIAVFFHYIVLHNSTLF